MASRYRRGAITFVTRVIDSGIRCAGRRAGRIWVPGRVRRSACVPCMSGQTPQNNHAVALSSNSDSPPEQHLSTTARVVDRPRAASRVVPICDQDGLTNMPTSQRPGKPTTGRALPATVDDFSKPTLNEPSRVLILDLLNLVKDRHPSLTAMIKAAMATPNRPSWAVGSPRDPNHVTKAKSTVSKILGSSASRCPDWPTIAWIIRNCAYPAQVTELTATMAGQWYEATGHDRPPGYTGAIHRGDHHQPELVDPDQAPDDTTRARLLEAHVRKLQTMLDERDNGIAQRDAQIDQLTSQLIDSEHLRQDTQHARDIRLQQQRSQNTAQLVRANAELRRATTGLRRGRDDNQVLRRHVELTAHYLAITVAYLIARRWPPHPDALLDVPSLRADPTLTQLLTPEMNHEASHLTRWLAAYLNTFLRTADPDSDGEIPPTLHQTDISAHLDDVLAAHRLPRSDLIDLITQRFPIAAEVLDNTLATVDTVPMPRITAEIPYPAVPAPAAPSANSDERTWITVHELILRENGGSQPDDPNGKRRRRQRG